MMLQRSNLKCLLLRGKNEIQSSGGGGFRCFGFLFFSHLSLAKLWAGGDSVGHPLVNAGAWKMLCPWRKGSKRFVLQLQRANHHRHMSQLLLWEAFCFSDNFSFLHKKTPNKQNQTKPKNQTLLGRLFDEISKFHSYLSIHSWFWNNFQKLIRV